MCPHGLKVQHYVLRKGVQSSWFLDLKQKQPMYSRRQVRLKHSYSGQVNYWLAAAVDVPLSNTLLS